MGRQERQQKRKLFGRLSGAVAATPLLSLIALTSIAQAEKAIDGKVLINVNGGIGDIGKPCG